MRPKGPNKLVWGLFAATFVASAALSEVIKPQHDQYVLAGRAVKSNNVRDVAVGDSAFQALLPTVLGIREAVASLMWVQADDYFHRGEYRPIIKMVHTITKIDPHQLDVYATGAWHMAYNFLDKRLIEDGIQFLEEGCENNDGVYDLYFELGYMHYDKTKDFKKSTAAYDSASQRGTTTGRETAPAFVRHQLAHAIEKMGDIDAAITKWEENRQKSEEEISAGEKSIGTAGPNLDAAQHNLYITNRRRNERLARLAEREGNTAEALRLFQSNLKLAEDWLKDKPNENVRGDLKVATNHVERLRGGKLNRTQPIDLNIRFTVTRVEPKKILVEGTTNVLDQSRVRVLIRDKDYEERIKRGFDFKMANCILEWDDVSVKEGKFKKLIDLDRDPADMDRNPEEIYPLKADEYELVVSYNPRLQAAFIQDLYGWHGENLRGPSDMIQEDPERGGVMEGKRYPLRYLSTSLVLKRDDILGTGKKLLAERK
ncbi:MAG: tetratricopeptide repeat protein [Armatimonadota bacterium]